MSAPDRFRLGVNYWPCETAMAWLPRYDLTVVQRDFARIAAAGMDTVRIFLRWEDMQPGARLIDRKMLARVVATADAALEAGVELIVTLFTGHMSGVNWVPAWATGGQDGDPRFRVVSAGSVRLSSTDLRNWYADREVLDGQAHLATGVAEALAGHPAVWAWDLGNENSNCTVPPDHASADRWLERMTTALRTTDPGTLVTIGTHMEDLEQDRRIGPAEAAEWCDFVCMHGYPIYADWSAGPTDPDLVPFLGEVTGWLAGEVPVLFAEFGHTTAARGVMAVAPQVSEGDAAIATGQVLDALHVGGAIGALLWCYADYVTDLYDRPPLDLARHERTFGLWRADGSPKPAVQELSERRERLCVAPPAERGWIDITPQELAGDRRRQLLRLYQRYCDVRPSPRGS